MAFIKRNALRRGTPKTGDVELPDSAGSGSAPSNVLILGTDVPLLNNWQQLAEPGDGDFAARAYIQGGRAYLIGIVVAPASDPTTSIICRLPAEFAPEQFGVADGDWTPRYAAAANDGTIGQIQLIVNDGLVGLLAHTSTGATIPTNGAYVGLDGVDWALAAA
jgi:hypothetical protein